MAGSKQNKSGGYGKRPMWQWVALYVVIGGLIYYGIYYLYTHRSSSTNSSGTTQHSLY